MSSVDNILKMKARIEKKVQWAGGFYFSNPANSCSDAGNKCVGVAIIKKQDRACVPSANILHFVGTINVDG